MRWDEVGQDGGRQAGEEEDWGANLGPKSSQGDSPQQHTGSTAGLGLYSSRQTEMALPGEALRENSTGAGVGSKLLS